MIKVFILKNKLTGEYYAGLGKYSYEEQDALVFTNEQWAKLNLKTIDDKSYEIIKGHIYFPIREEIG